MPPVEKWQPLGSVRRFSFRVVRLFQGTRQGKGTWIPAVALTAYARAEGRGRALAAGYQVHVAKAIDPVEFTLVVAGQLARGARLTFSATLARTLSAARLLESRFPRGLS